MFFRRGFVYAKNILCSEKYLVNSFSDLKECLYINPHSVMQASPLKTHSSFLTNNLKESLLELGLPEGDFNKILCQCPEIGKIDVERARLCIDSLMKCQFGEESLIELIKRSPYILSLEPRKIEEVFMNLIVRFNKPNVYKIFFSSPEVFNESISQIVDKVNYLEERMFVSKGRLVNSGALSHPLNRIKLRHTFLERAGVFEKIDPKLEPHERNKINPKIGDILNSSDHEFSTKIAGVSLQEFEVFQELFNLEDDL